ncbi:uncharacterized protein EV420DRAFT_1550776 [Desarmillaria tabescens]|uniref:Uncharacterized protein n=1 Tax=Armillaria tabescens TaxID=1929756 RepID=A0AA39KBN2_ARMTA|nr:uncharacterized protein EV420DRAFT_1550776 [Desarmillaria tabescens]KAK0457005.1 hypothetical protein EV420DRAFT_1550776 [Desarmillaria tabescens]
MATSHILSKKSTRLERDTFIFSTTAPTRLVLGLNQSLTPVSSATLHRWIRLIARRISPFTFHPVTIRRFGILSYAIELKGEEISAASTESLPAGNYAWYWPDGKQAFPEITAFTQLAPFPEMMPAGKDLETLFDVVPSVAEAVVQRDHHRCFVTGIMSPPDDVGLIWVFPPDFFYLLFYYKTAEDQPPPCPEFFKVASNAGFMYKRLIPFFIGNAFSIDVDDGHRIVVFRDMGSAQSLLPSHIVGRDGEGLPADKFLREHFRVSMQVNLLGGDICEDYNHNDILDMMEELGVEGEDYVEPPPLTDPRWQTVLGKAILEDVLLSKASVACLDDLDVD